MLINSRINRKLSESTRYKEILICLKIMQIWKFNIRAQRIRVERVRFRMCFKRKSPTPIQKLLGRLRTIPLIKNRPTKSGLKNFP